MAGDIVVASETLRIGILGAGAWGTAVGLILAEKGYDVELWAHNPEVVDDINEHHMNRRHLGSVELPHNLRAGGNLELVALNKDVLFLATPSLFIMDTLRSILTVPTILEGETVIAILTKGFVPTKRGPELLVNAMENYLPGFYKGKVVYVSGPSHAEEVARHKLTGLISASQSPKHSILIREILNSPSLIAFSSLDVVGVQISAAMKNVIAIAFGILDALKEGSNNVGDNTESLLLAAGLNEIQTLARAVGASHPETFTSIGGVGDLDVTCRSIYGRNRRFGRDIILNHILDDFSGIEDICGNFERIGYLSEGVAAARSVVELASKYKLKLPICSSVFSMLDKKTSPEQAIGQMLEGFTSRSRDAFLPSSE